MINRLISFINRSEGLDQIVIYVAIIFAILSTCISTLIYVLNEDMQNHNYIQYGMILSYAALAAFIFDSRYRLISDISYVTKIGPGISAYPILTIVFLFWTLVSTAKGFGTEINVYGISFISGSFALALQIGKHLRRNRISSDAENTENSGA